MSLRQSCIVSSSVIQHLSKLSLKISKQIAINQIRKLPLEVLDIVKSYCFYDVKTGIALKLHRMCISDINDHFYDPYITRARSFGLMTNPDSQEQWSICLSRRWVEDDDEAQISAQNCSICGNYKYSSCWRNIAAIEILNLIGEELFNQIWKSNNFHILIDMRMHGIINHRLKCNCTI